MAGSIGATRTVGSEGGLHKVDLPMSPLNNLGRRKIRQQLAADFLNPAWADVETLLGLDTADQSQYADARNSLLRDRYFLAAAAFRVPDFHGLLSASDSEVAGLWMTTSLPAWVKAVACCQAMWVNLSGCEDGAAISKVQIQDRIRVLQHAIPALTTMLDWIQYRQFGGIPDSVIQVALAQSKGPSSIVNELWAGEDSLLQTVMLPARHPDKAWPSSMIFKRALTVFSKRASQKVGTLIDLSKNESGHGIFWPLTSTNDQISDVVNLPVLMGFWAMTGVAVDWWDSLGRLRQLAEIYAFDPIWFNTAYNQASKIALAYGVQLQVDGGGA